MTAKKKNLKAPLDLLFEIGTEELPATNLADFLESSGGSSENYFSEKLKKGLLEKRISFASCQAWATPRRLVFYVQGVAPHQEAKDQMIKVLSKEEAFGADGKPTEKFLTILKHRSVSVDDIVIEDLNGRPFAYIKKAEPALPTDQVLPQVLEALVKNLGFPKNMKWDDSGIYFSRPIRSYLCLYGEKHLKFKIGHTPASDTTVVFSRGERVKTKIKNIPQYFKTLEKWDVILDQKERKVRIRTSLEKLAKSLHVDLYEDEFLLSEVNYLVEAPHTLSAPFGKEFLDLPLEVLTVSMARKQRIFGVLDKKKAPMPQFLAVLDGVRNAAETKKISQNIGQILRAKLQDSLFFYREDTKVRLDKKREELKNLVFLKGAGSMLEKSERLAKLAHVIGLRDSDLSREERASLERAACLCKADLLTQMVGEFPELQGIMGKYYARENKESDGVASAIGEQYLPRTANDVLPATRIGSLLSILDKLDLITACFGLGLEPSSSVDPYGLRRSAIAIHKIILDKKLDFSFQRLLADTKNELAPYISKDKEPQLLKRLDDFFKDRFKALLADRGFPEDVTEAAMASKFDSPYEVFLRVEILSKLADRREFQESAKIVERTFNILKGNKEPLPDVIRPEVFTEPLEREVFQKYQESAATILGAIQGRDYALATSLYAGAFFDILGKFFEKVFINTEDLNVRKNRLLLLKSIKDLYTKDIAELSKIRHKEIQPS